VKPWTLADIGISAPANRVNLEALFVPETKVETEYIEGDTPQEKGEKLAVRLREAKLI
jgi:electron transfer flavoprotein alpha/beta subunit